MGLIPDTLPHLTTRVIGTIEKKVRLGGFLCQAEGGGETGRMSSSFFDHKKRYRTKKVVTFCRGGLYVALSMTGPNFFPTYCYFIFQKRSIKSSLLIGPQVADISYDEDEESFKFSLFEFIRLLGLIRY